MVAHRLSTIRNVDLIYVFKNGQVVESGNHDELMDRKGHYYDMVTLQTFPDELEEGKDRMLNILIIIIINNNMKSYKTKENFRNWKGVNTRDVHEK